MSASNAPAKTPAAPRRVLIVEDARDLASAVGEFLAGRGFAVRLVENGVDALKAVMEQDYDVIICDMVMPKMPGDMLYEAVKRVKPHLCERFLFTTAHGESPRVREFLTHVSEMVLSKPFHLDDLLENVDLLLRGLDDRVRKLDVPDDEHGPRPLRPPRGDLG